jgi:hypothetical protein
VFLPRPSPRRLRAISVALVFVAGCHSSGSSGSDGPSEDEVTQDLIAGLPHYINKHCTVDKANMLASVKDVRYTIQKQDLLNTINGKYQVIRLDGTLYWSYANKAAGHDPSAGTQLNILMTNDPTTNPDRTDKWEFLTFGPWSEILQFGNGKNCEFF